MIGVVVVVVFEHILANNNEWLAIAMYATVHNIKDTSECDPMTSNTRLQCKMISNGWWKQSKNKITQRTERSCASCIVYMNWVHQIDIRVRICVRYNDIIKFDWWNNREKRFRYKKQDTIANWKKTRTRDDGPRTETGKNRFPNY